MVRGAWMFAAVLVGGCFNNNASDDATSSTTGSTSTTTTTSPTTTSPTTAQPTAPTTGDAPGTSTTGDLTTVGSTGDDTTASTLPDPTTAAGTTGEQTTGDPSDTTTGAPVVCPYLLCEDFEDFDDGQSPESALWKFNKADDSVLVVDAVRPHGGARALHVTTPPHPAQAYIRNTSVFPVAGNKFYGRVYYYLQGPEPAKFVHWNLIEATGPAKVDGKDYTKLIRYGGVQLPSVFDHYIFNFEMYGHPPGFDEFGLDEKPEFPDADKWICVEWMFDGGEKPEARLWRDDLEIETLHATSPIGDVSFTFPEFDGLNIGWTIYQEIDAPFDVWIDDIVVDDAPIGCGG